MRDVLTSGCLQQLDLMWRCGDTIDCIADALSVSKWTVVDYIRRHRDRYPNRNHHIDWWRDRLAPYEGTTGVYASMMLGCSEKTVSYWRRRIRSADEGA